MAVVVVAQFQNERRAARGSAVALKRHWVLGREGFEALLASLDPDRDRAAERYEQLRRALHTFFECRGAVTSDELADETMNRVARRLLEGQTIHAENPASYFYGVARNLLKEFWESRRRVPLPFDGQPIQFVQAPDAHQLQERRAERLLLERRLDALDRCLGDLDARDHELIKRYYEGEAGARIQNRRRLAADLGIGPNALRIRALRIREKLEAGLERRLAAGSSSRACCQA